MRRKWNGSRTPEDVRAREEASAWLPQLERDSSPPGFAEWLRKDPRNVEAILDLSAFDREMTRFVRKIHRRAAPAQLSRTARFPEWWRPVAIAASMLGLIATGAGWYFAPPAVQVTVSDYRTEVGEQRVITLADGSKVHLNTQSHLQSRFTSEGREVDLLAGEAMFIVVKDGLRPFRVHTDSAIVQATGTQFNVDRHDERLVIAVIEGSVRVALPGPPGYTELTRFAPLQAGELLEVQRKIKGAELHITMPPADRLARRVRWTSGVLTFADEPLADVVAEINRYNRRQIVIEDPAIAGLAIGGRFKPTDLPTFVESLRSMTNVEVEWPADAKPIRLRKPKSTTL